MFDKSGLFERYLKFKFKKDLKIKLFGNFASF